MTLILDHTALTVSVFYNLQRDTIATKQSICAFTQYNSRLSILFGLRHYLDVSFSVSLAQGKSFAPMLMKEYGKTYSAYHCFMT